MKRSHEIEKYSDTHLYANWWNIQDCFAKVFSYLSAFELLNSFSVCRAWKAHDNSVVWASIYGGKHDELLKIYIQPQTLDGCWLDPHDTNELPDHFCGDDSSLPLFEGTGNKQIELINNNPQIWPDDFTEYFVDRSNDAGASMAVTEYKTKNPFLPDTWEQDQIYNYYPFRKEGERSIKQIVLDNERNEVMQDFWKTIVGYLDAIDFFEILGKEFLPDDKFIIDGDLQQTLCELIQVKNRLLNADAGRNPLPMWILVFFALDVVLLGRVPFGYKKKNYVKILPKTFRITEITNAQNSCAAFFRLVTALYYCDITDVSRAYTVLSERFPVWRRISNSLGGAGIFLPDEDGRYTDFWINHHGNLSMSSKEEDEIYQNDKSNFNNNNNNNNNNNDNDSDNNDDNIMKNEIDTPEEDEIPLQYALKRGILRLAMRVSISKSTPDAIQMAKSCLKDFVASTVLVANKISEFQKKTQEPVIELRHILASLESGQRKFSGVYGEYNRQPFTFSENKKKTIETQLVDLPEVHFYADGRTNQENFPPKTPKIETATTNISTNITTNITTTTITTSTNNSIQSIFDDSEEEFYFNPPFRYSKSGNINSKISDSKNIENTDIFNDEVEPVESSDKSNEIPSEDLADEQCQVLPWREIAKLEKEAMKEDEVREKSLSDKLLSLLDNNSSNNSNNNNNSFLCARDVALDLLKITKKVYQEVYQTEMPANWHHNWILCNNDISQHHPNFAKPKPKTNPEPELDDCEDFPRDDSSYEFSDYEGDAKDVADKEDYKYFGESLYSMYPESHVTAEQQQNVDVKKQTLRKKLREETEKYLTETFEEKRLNEISKKYFPSNDSNQNSVPLYSIIYGNSPSIESSSSEILSKEEAAKFEKLTNLAIRPSHFTKLCHEILLGIVPNEPDFRISKSALMLLQESSEEFLRKIMCQAGDLAIHEKQLETQCRTLRAVVNIAGESPSEDDE